MKLFFVLTAFAFFFCDSHSQTVPYFLSLEEVDAYDLPSIHSYAKAQSGSYWLVVGGRTDGMHSFFPNSAFPVYEQNNNVFVIDTNTWQVWSSSLFNVDYSSRTSLSSVNTEFIQQGNYLYVAGGYGYDSLSFEKLTFPTLTALDVDGIITEIVIGGSNLNQFVRQIVDSNFALAGGKLELLNNRFYLIGGQKFNGFYTKLNSDFFEQKYSNSISSFILNDDGENISISDFQFNIDTVNFHRRDLNSAPTINSNSEEGIGVYGGVFKYDHDLPFQNPIYISATGIVTDFSFEQKMSQYTCPIITVFDSVNNDMHSIFIGGISLYDLVDSSQILKLDTMVPYINDITTLIQHSNGTSEEIILPTKFPELGGANAEFFLNQSVPHYSNGVIKLSSLNKSALLGYIYGGLVSSSGNEGITKGSNKVYKVFLDPSIASTAPDIEGKTEFQIFPNPAHDFTNIIQFATGNKIESIIIFDLLGKEVHDFKYSINSSGLIRINTSNLFAGMYSVIVITNTSTRVLQFAVVDN